MLLFASSAALLCFCNLVLKDNRELDNFDKRSIHPAYPVQGHWGHSLGQMEHKTLNTNQHLLYKCACMYGVTSLSFTNSSLLSYDDTTEQHFLLIQDLDLGQSGGRAKCGS